MKRALSSPPARSPSLAGGAARASSSTRRAGRVAHAAPDGRAGAAGAGAGRHARARSRRSTPTRHEQRRRSATLPRIVYFDFDSYVVKDEFRPVDRGQRASAERRTASATSPSRATPTNAAAANTTWPSASGAPKPSPSARRCWASPTTQIEAVSFGKEKPAVQGSDEDAWAKNRRAELATADDARLARLARLAAAACVACSLAGAPAGARRRCSTTTRRAAPSSSCASSIEQSNEQARARQAEQMRADVDDRSSSSSAACSTCRQQIEALRADNAHAARPERAARARRRRRCSASRRTSQQGVDDRMRKFEPQKVTVDGREFSPTRTKSATTTPRWRLPQGRLRRRRRPRSPSSAASAIRNSGYRRVGAVLARQRAVRATATTASAIDDLPRAARAGAGPPARARGRAVHRQLPDRAEGQRRRAPHARRTGQGLSAVGSRAGAAASGWRACAERGAGRAAVRLRRRRAPTSSAASAACAPLRRAGARAHPRARMSRWSASAASAPGRPRRWRAAASAR